jgi:hypothetical protein
VLTIDGVAKSLYAPSMYDWSEINAKPTKLSDFTDDVVAGKYLPLSGGTIDGNLSLGIDNSTTAQNYFRIYRKHDSERHTFLASLTDDKDYELAYYNSTIGTYARLVIGTSGYKVGGYSLYDLIHSGNYSNYALPLSGGTLEGSLSLGKDGESANPYNYRIFQKVNGVQHRASLGITDSGDVELSYYSSTNSTYKRLLMGGSGLKIGGYDYELYDILHSGNISNYNAGSATKLQTARSLWGNSFDGTSDVGGNFYHAGTTFITLGDTFTSFGNTARTTYIDGKDIWFNASGVTNMVVTTSGNVGIGTVQPSHLLHVDGTMYGDLKMKTPRNIWGQAFDGTGDVTGSLYYEGARFVSPGVTFTSFGNTSRITYIDGNGIWFNASGNPDMIIDNTGNVIIGATTIAQNGITTNEITIGGVRIYVEDGALKINGNVFAVGQLASGV